MNMFVNASNDLMALYGTVGRMRHATAGERKVQETASSRLRLFCVAKHTWLSTVFLSAATRPALLAADSGAEFSGCDPLELRVLTAMPHAVLEVVDLKVLAT